MSLLQNQQYEGNLPYDGLTKGYVSMTSGVGGVADPNIRCKLSANFCLLMNLDSKEPKGDNNNF
ncbi:MAG: hypothetical protein WA114_07040 [Psychrobacter glacincola]